MEVFLEQEKIERAPSVETCIQWELKLGLFKLTRPKVIADDWIWIPDHVVNKGGYKCLVVLGVRMSNLLENEDLTISHKDVEPLAIVPMKTSNGPLMQSEFESILEQCNGVPPLAIVADHGSDLRCGSKLFSETYSDVINIYDITHKIARLYEYRLVDEIQWENFSKRCSNFKKQVQLTDYAKLAPPNQRSKARYHNIDVLVDWGTNKLKEYESMTRDEQEKLSWIKEYQSDIEYWKQLVDAGRVGRDLIRKKGFWKGCEDELSDLLIDMKLCSQAENFVCDLITFVEEEGNKVANGKHIIGSTEIIESLFGRYKNISERGPKPMGRIVLTMASRVGERPTEELIETAFESVKEKDVDEWITRAFG